MFGSLPQFATPNLLLLSHRFAPTPTPAPALDSPTPYERQQDEIVKENYRRMRELGVDVVASIFNNWPTKNQGARGGRSGRNSCHGAGSDLSDYDPEDEEPDEGDDDTELEEEAAPLAIEVVLLSCPGGLDI